MYQTFACLNTTDLPTNEEEKNILRPFDGNNLRRDSKIRIKKITKILAVP